MRANREGAGRKRERGQTEGERERERERERVRESKYLHGQCPCYWLLLLPARPAVSALPPPPRAQLRTVRRLNRCFTADTISGCFTFTARGWAAASQPLIIPTYRCFTVTQPLDFGVCPRLVVCLRESIRESIRESVVCCPRLVVQAHCDCSDRVASTLKKNRNGEP